MDQILLHRDGAPAVTYGGAHRDPSPHTQADLGVGGHVRERELGPRDHMTCYVITRPCHVTIPGRRGGDPLRHRSRDTIFISRELRTLGLVGPLPHLNSKYTQNTHLFSVHARQAHIRPRLLFFANSSLNINFKGVHMKLKIVALAITMALLIFTIFSTFHSYSSIARANKPYAGG